LYEQSFLSKAVEQGLIASDPSYRSETARHADLIYQALNKGLISKGDPEKSTTEFSDITDPADNYRFLRKYFPAKWTKYALSMRLLSGVNPISEIRAYMSVRDQRKIDLNDSPALYDEFEKAPIDGLLSNAKVSVIIPTLNRYSYLKDVFSDLEKQTHRNFEVLVCDQSDPFDASCYSGWTFEMQVIRQEEKALWMARNTCLERASGDLILLFDDDSRVEPDWIEQHIRCLSYFNAPISAGVTDTIVYQALHKRAWMVKVNGSNVASAMVDSIVFPTIAFGAFLPLIVLGQFAAKVGGGFMWAWIIGKFRARRVQAEPA
jgi:hypothetical protein